MMTKQFGPQMNELLTSNDCEKILLKASYQFYETFM